VLDDALAGHERRNGRQPQPLDREPDLLPLVQDEEALLRDVMVGGLEQRRERDQAHEL
jgi:hypothetical protein